jgi:hypothetical protein
MKDESLAFHCNAEKENSEIFEPTDILRQRLNAVRGLKNVSVLTYKVDFKLTPFDG